MSLAPVATLAIRQGICTFSQERASDNEAMGQKSSSVDVIGNCNGLHDLLLMVRSINTRKDVIPFREPADTRDHLRGFQEIKCEVYLHDSLEVRVRTEPLTLERSIV